MQRNRLILIVDDNADDLFLLRRSLKKVGVLNPVREVRSGREAMAYLTGEGHTKIARSIRFLESCCSICTCQVVTVLNF
jgi:CheY-like chemotaxis protein